MTGQQDNLIPGNLFEFVNPPLSGYHGGFYTAITDKRIEMNHAVHITGIFLIIQVCFVKTRQTGTEYASAVTRNRSINTVVVSGECIVIQSNA